MVLSSSTMMSEPYVRLRAPPSYYFTFPPSSEPQTLSPGSTDYSLARPFNIDPELYNRLLDVRVPLTVGAVYATTVYFLNRLNKSRGNKPWAISKTSIFFAFVIIHNVLLAVYSGWTFVGMANALRNIWPGWKDSKSLVEVVDAYCKTNGPRGLGDAAWWDHENGTWTVGNPAIKLLGGLLPDNSDVGRLWNEGLAFYGWMFYISKFYEVIDTMIILAKGKRSSFLQTYHHTGAMLCMWAGIRYMSPPIWMFVFVNSGIHALMYTYYTLSALSIKVPSLFKRTLTTLQITQFVVGMTYAVFHLFVAYRVPIYTPYVFLHNLSTALPSATSSIATAASSADVGSWAKKVMLRAVGDEGLSENVRNNNGNLFGHEGTRAAQIELAEVQKARQEIRHRLEYTEANCIDTSGQAFAILLNSLYLLPLTLLFVRFFVKSYLRRTSGTAHPDHSKAISKSSYAAVKGVEREVLKAMSRDRGSAYNSTSNSDTENHSPADPDVQAKANSFKSKADEEEDFLSKKIRNRNAQATQVVQEHVQWVKEEISQSVDKLENFDDLSEETREVISRVTQNTKEVAADLMKLTKEKAEKIVQELKEATSSGITDEPKSSQSQGDTSTETKKAKEGSSQLDKKTQEGKKTSVETEEDKESEESTGEKADNTSAIKREDDEESKEERQEERAAQSYETSIDEVTTAEQKDAESKMQPDVVSESKS